MRTKALVILMVMLLWASFVPRAVPLAHASEVETITLFDETKSTGRIANLWFYKTGSYSVPSGKKIISATVQITIDVSGFNTYYRRYVDVFINGPSNWKGDADFRATETHWEKSYDVTDYIEGDSFNYEVSVQLANTNGHLPGQDFTAHVRGVLTIVLEDTSGGGGTGGTTKAPIPWEIIPLVAAEAVLIARKKRK